MPNQDRYSIVKLTIASFSFLWLMVLFIPTAYACEEEQAKEHADAHTASVADSDAHASPVTTEAGIDSPATTQAQTDSVSFVDFIHTYSEDHRSPIDGCVTKCCQILAGVKVLTNTKFNDENTTYVIGSINLPLCCLKLAYSSKLIYSSSSSPLSNTLQFRVLLI
jgi:hypothetical protein